MHDFLAIPRRTWGYTLKAKGWRNLGSLGEVDEAQVRMRNSLKMGLYINVAGMLLALIGAEQIVGTLVAKVLYSQGEDGMKECERMGGRGRWTEWGFSSASICHTVHVLVVTTESCLFPAHKFKSLENTRLLPAAYHLVGALGIPRKRLPTPRIYHGPDWAAFFARSRFPAIRDGGEHGGRRGSPGTVPRSGRFHSAGQHQHLAEPLLLAGGVAVAARQDT